MGQEEVKRIVEHFREFICDISDEEVEDVLKICRRKLAIIGKEESYLKLLFPDELKNYIFRRAVNATTVLRQLKKEESVCARCAEIVRV